MGAAATITAITGDAITYARTVLQDFSSLLVVVVGFMVFGAVWRIVRS